MLTSGQRFELFLLTSNRFFVDLIVYQIVDLELFFISLKSFFVDLIVDHNVDLIIELIVYIDR